MKKIFLVTVSCFTLTSSWAFAMIEDPLDKQLSIIVKQPVTTGELREYICKSTKIYNIKVAVSIFDDFVEGLNNTVFTKEKKSIQDFQNRKKIFQQLQNNYIKSVDCFYTAFNVNLRENAQTPLPNQSDGKAIRPANYIMHYPSHEPYYRAFQNLSNQFLSIRENCLAVPLVSNFEILGSTEDVKLKTFLFKDKGEYVPSPFYSNRPYDTMSVLYGSQLLPQKQFTFRKGILIEDSGIILSPFKDCLKLLTQYGRATENPFTADRLTCRMPYDHDGPLMGALIAQFGLEELANQVHFITLPTTKEEQDILELLFLEDLIEENKEIINPQSQKFIEWVRLEVEKEEKVTIEARIEELKEQIINAPKTATLENTSEGIQLISKKYNTQSKQKKKTKGKPGKNQSGKINNTPQKQQNNQSSSKATLGNEKKKKAEELFSNVKKEGRVKFREILGIMNKIRSSSSDNEIFNKFATIGRKGSHINFHLEDGEGLTLVKKHGKEDLTYPAKQVNYFSMRLINAMFSFTD